MLTELQTNLEAILNEKNTKIIPANIKSGVTIFNVVGTATETNEEASRNVTITGVNQTFTPAQGYTGMSEIVVTSISPSVDSDIVAGNIKEGVSILGVTGTVREIPNGIFIQDTRPTKTTDEAIWLQETASIDVPFLSNVPNDVLAWKNSSDVTVAEFILGLSSAQQTAIESFNQHLLFVSGDTIHIIASDTLYYDPSNNATVTFDNTDKAYVVYNTSGIVDYSSNTTISTAQMLSTANKYTDKNIYNTTGTIVTVLPYQTTTNYLEITVGEKKYAVQINRGSQFNKILDTSDGNITASNVDLGKIAYSNNTKIIGTSTKVDTSDATATLADIAAGKTAYVDGVKVTGIGAMTFATVAEMNLVTTVPEDTLAIVYGNDYVGTYRFDNGSWTEIGSASQGQQSMNALNEVMGSSDQYEGLGGTEEQVSEVMDDILGIEEE